MTLSPASTCQEIHNWLSTLLLQLPEWYIHPKLVSYTDQQRKKHELKRILNHPKLPEDYKVSLHLDYQLPDTLSTLLPKIRNSGTLVVMSGPLYAASDLNHNDPAFHTFVFLYKNNTAIIVDPGYRIFESKDGEEEEAKRKGKMRFSSMGGGLGLAISLLRKMKGKHAILKYWLGKGSVLEYDDLNCNTMAQDFVENFIIGGGSIDIDWEEEGFEEMGV